ncbi:helix-turn-helix transcriptional regulator [Pseudomonas sp. 3JA]|uniref:helix-turn-helix transcriptional regulator n=1 Tax=Pseudomonas sp. 3JA TaxID=3109347 RepID=UPI0030083CC5
MQAILEVTGEDVVGLPGQNLTQEELFVLTGLANGENPSSIGARLQIDSSTIRHIETSIKAKLGAKTHPHMIARGFTLGVLFSRALCLFLAVISVAEHPGDTMRTRSGRRSRTTPASTRVVRTNGSAGGKGHSNHTRHAEAFAYGGTQFYMS